LTESTDHKRPFPTIDIRQSSKEQEKAALREKQVKTQKDEEKRNNDAQN